MAYDEQLADRIRSSLKKRNIHFDEIEMMGGLTFMVDDKLCIGIVKSDLMLRLNPDDHEKLISIQGCRPMDFTNTPMRGYVFIEPDSVEGEEDLENWIQLALHYNPKAKSSEES